MFSYLSNRQQRVKTKICYNDRRNINYGLLQRKILGPLLCNIDLIGFFHKCNHCRIASYSDGKTPYFRAKDIPVVIMQLESTASKLFS